MSGNNGSGRFGKLKQSVGMDDALAKDGAWLVLDEGEGVRWRVRSAFARSVQRIQHEVNMRAMEASLGAGVPDFDVATDGDAELISRAIVAGWEGMVDDAGEPVPCTPEAVAEALEAFPEWRARVLVFARSPKHFRRPSARAVAAVEGN